MDDNIHYHSTHEHIHPKSENPSKLHFLRFKSGGGGGGYKDNMDVLNFYFFNDKITTKMAATLLRRTL